MVGGMAGARVLPEEVSAQILGRTDGVPLFVEELTKAVLESGLPADHAQPAVPAMLHDTLMARLDRTAAMKGVAQTAAVLGRDFSEALLAAVSPLEGGALAAALDALVRAELLFRKGRPPHAGYVFKHALVRDIAYESLLVSSRRQLHARTAAALERAFPEIAEAQPELLAHHHEAAGMPERAIAAWRRAGARAAASSNYVEAERQLARALALLPQLPEERRSRAELDLQMALGAIYRATRGTGSSQTERCYGRARVLCEEAGEEDRLLEVVYGQFICAFNRPRLHDAERHAKEFMEIAQRRGDAAAQLVAHHLAGITAFLFGDLNRARQDLEHCLRSGDADSAQVALYSQGQVPSGAMTYLAWTLFALGYPDAAHALASRSVEACKGGPAFPYAMALSNACYLRHMCGEVAGVEAILAALLDLAADKGIVVFYETAQLFQGWARARRGATDDGIAQTREALARLASTEQQVEYPYLVSILAETFLQAGRRSEARDRLEEALRQVEATEERWYEAELHRLAGELALAEGDTAGAEARFRCAVSVATAQSARLWTLRVATRLARLWRDAGQPREAHAMLAPLLADFTEGFDTPDLKDAKALLDELA
jgi:predicted ATPase